MHRELKTSRNQISRNIKRLADMGEDSVLVYGCGRFVNEVKARLGGLESWAWYEPYVESLNVMPEGSFNHVVLDNVLNVIENKEEMTDIIYKAWGKVNLGGSLWVNIYEGNKSGVAEFTGNKCQRNEKIENYRWAFKGLGCIIEKINGGYRLRKI